MTPNSVYIVRRESCDGPEVDVFLDWDLAKRWAQHIGAEVEEEGIIDRKTLASMTRATPKDEEGD